MSKVKVYTSSNCSNCQSLKEFLEDEGLLENSEIINISENRTEKDFLMYKLHIFGVPALYNPATEQSIKGFTGDHESRENVLELYRK